MISVFLNNALKATPQLVELDCENALPEIIRDMPDEVQGHFVEMDAARSQEMRAAWKRVLVFNSTRVRYSFRYDPATGEFVATKR
jgi:hypothetical protein